MPKEEKMEIDDKAAKGFWPCQSYKCTKSGKNHMNPKFADKCQQCGAMKSFTANAGHNYNHGMDNDRFEKNKSKRK